MTNYTQNYFESEDNYKKIAELISDFNAIYESGNYSELPIIINKIILFDNSLLKKLGELNITNESSNDDNDIGNSQSRQGDTDILITSNLVLSVTKQIIKILKLMKQLAIRSANGTYNDEQRILLTNQYIDLRDSIVPLILSIKVPNSQVSLFSESKQTLNLIIPGTSNKIQLKIEFPCTGINICNTDLYTQENSREAIEKIQKKIDGLNNTLVTNSSATVQVKEVKGTSATLLKTKLKAFIKILEQRADYWKCKGRLNFYNSDKGTIPDWLS